MWRWRNKGVFTQEWASMDDLRNQILFQAKEFDKKAMDAQNISIHPPQ